MASDCLALSYRKNMRLAVRYTRLPESDPVEKSKTE